MLEEIAAVRAAIAGLKQEMAPGAASAAEPEPGPATAGGGAGTARRLLAQLGRLPASHGP